MKVTYKNLRIKIFAVILIATAGVIGYLVYKDLTTSPRMPESIPQAVAADAPVKSDPPNDNEKKTYTVPAVHPRRLIINKINVDALIKPVGVLSGGTLDAPKTAWDAGWYEKSGLPGENGVPLLLDGHVNDALNAAGVFFQLNTLKPGDSLTVERGDGQMIGYDVTKVDMLPDDKVDMRSLLAPNSSRPTLVIITCGGIYDRLAKTYTDRVIIHAEKV